MSSERIRHTDKFDDTNLSGEMQTTISSTKLLCETGLNIERKGLHEIIPPKAGYFAPQESLKLIALLVAAEIPAEPDQA